MGARKISIKATELFRKLNKLVLSFIVLKAELRRKTRQDVIRSLIRASSQK